MAAKEGRQPEYKGESYQFVVDVPSTLLCNVCLELCSDPQQAVCCGKLFCLKCITIAKTKSNSGNCPCCRQPIKTFSDKRTKQEIGNLQIICPNVGRGCRERPELRNAGEHKNVCPLELISCQFSDVGCRETMLRKDSKDHNRTKIVEHLDLCRRRIAKLEKIQTAPLSDKGSCLQSPSDVKRKQVQKGELVLSCQPSCVVKIEVSNQARILRSGSSFQWKSDIFQLGNWKLGLLIHFNKLQRLFSDSEHFLSLKIAELVPRQRANAMVEIYGDCDLLLSESGVSVYQFKPFQITFTCEQGDIWTSENDTIGTFSSSDAQIRRFESSPRVYYKLNIWKIA